MSKYNLDHFPPVDFEAFCQSLLVSLLGFRVQFSHHRGPDAGVDASYEGKSTIKDFQGWAGK